MKLAKQVITNPNALIVDTETTGLRGTDQILQIAVVQAATGKVLFDDYVCPVGISTWTDAQKIHGIKPRDVKDKRRIVDCGVLDILKSGVLYAWNSNFDSRMLYQSVYACNYPYSVLNWNDLMVPYSSQYTSNGRWQKLTDACARHGVTVAFAHSALGDAMMTLELMRTLAELE